MLILAGSGPTDRNGNSLMLPGKNDSLKMVAEELAALEIPVLIIGGTADLQVPVSDAESLHAAHPESELLIIDDMNHVLKTLSDEVVNEAAYSDPDLPMSDGLMEEIFRFLE